MTNEVNKPTDDATTGEGSVEQTKQQEQPTAVPAPVKEESSDDTQSSGDIDFGAILEQFEQEQTVYHAGDLVEGKVVGVSDHGVMVDFGYKSEGLIPSEESLPQWLTLSMLVTRSRS